MFEDKLFHSACDDGEKLCDELFPLFLGYMGLSAQSFPDFL